MEEGGKGNLVLAVGAGLDSIESGGGEMGKSGVGDTGASCSGRRLLWWKACDDDDGAGGAGTTFCEARAYLLDACW